jgi:hypothetical protein
MTTEDVEALKAAYVAWLGKVLAALGGKPTRFGAELKRAGRDLLKAQLENPELTDAEKRLIEKTRTEWAGKSFSGSSVGSWTVRGSVPDTDLKRDALCKLVSDHAPDPPPEAAQWTSFKDLLGRLQATKEQSRQRNPVKGAQSIPRNTVAAFKKTRRLRGDAGKQRSLVEAARAHYDALGYQWTSTGRHFLTRSDWSLDEPLPLTDNNVTYKQSPVGPEEGLYEASSRYWPEAPDGTPIERYSDAITAHDPPSNSSLWTNNLSYRLVDLSRTNNWGFELTVARMNYFDGYDCWAALEFESLVRLEARESFAGPYRVAMGEPFDLAQRNVAVGVSVLTVRRDPELGNSYYLHLRSKDDATLPNMFGALPAGEFQPASKGPGSFGDDLSLWKCILREYAEEMLGYPVQDQHGNAPDYDERIVTFSNQLGEGVQPYILDFGLDPVTLKAGFRIVCIIDAEVFDMTFADMVERTDEGEVLGSKRSPLGKLRKGFPLTEKEVAKMLNEDGLTAAVRFLITETWRNREFLGLTAP